MQTLRDLSLDPDDTTCVEIGEAAWYYNFPKHMPLPDGVHKPTDQDFIAMGNAIVDYGALTGKFLVLSPDEVQVLERIAAEETSQWHNISHGTKKLLARMRGFLTMRRAR